jgi:hypothetical protein
MYIYVYTYVYRYVYIRIYMYIDMNIYAYACKYVYLHTKICIWILDKTYAHINKFHSNFCIFKLTYIHTTQGNRESVEHGKDVEIRVDFI